MCTRCADIQFTAWTNIFHFIHQSALLRSPENYTHFQMQLMGRTFSPKIVANLLNIRPSLKIKWTKAFQCGNAESCVKNRKILFFLFLKAYFFLFFFFFFCILSTMCKLSCIFFVYFKSKCTKSHVCISKINDVILLLTMLFDQSEN